MATLRMRLIQGHFGLPIRCIRTKSSPVLWQRPQADWVKLNFDGASKGKAREASIGGIVRNHRGEPMLGYAEPIGRYSSFAAECVALKRGLQLVTENGWLNVWAEGDAKSLVEIIAPDKKKIKSREVVELVKDIKLIIPEFDNWMFSHIYREGNRAADKLAKMGFTLNKLKVWKRHHIPLEVLRFAREDKKGRIIYRKK